MSTTFLLNRTSIKFNYCIVLIYYLCNLSLFSMVYPLLLKTLSLLQRCEKLYVPLIFLCRLKYTIKTVWLLRSELPSWLNRVKQPFAFNYKVSFAFLALLSHISSFNCVLYWDHYYQLFCDLKKKRSNNLNTYKQVTIISHKRLTTFKSDEHLTFSSCLRDTYFLR